MLQVIFFKESKAYFTFYDLLKKRNKTFRTEN